MIVLCTPPGISLVANIDRQIQMKGARPENDRKTWGPKVASAGRVPCTENRPILDQVCATKANTSVSLWNTVIRKSEK